MGYRQLPGSGNKAPDDDRGRALPRFQAGPGRQPDRRGEDKQSLTWPLFTVHIRHDRDIVHARQRARLVAARLGFEVPDQTRIATAVSEVCRNAYAYAGGGKAEFRIEESSGRISMVVEVSDGGPGIAELDEILAGRYHSRTGMGLGLLGSRRLMDRLEIDTSENGTSVLLARIVQRPLDRPVPEFLNKLMDELARQQPLDPVEEVQRQNQELAEQPQRPSPAGGGTAGGERGAPRQRRGKGSAAEGGLSPGQEQPPDHLQSGQPEGRASPPALLSGRNWTMSAAASTRSASSTKSSTSRKTSPASIWPATSATSAPICACPSPRPATAPN